MKKGILTVVSGFSGAGKGTIIKELRKKYDYELSISATTRKPRKGDVDGVDYFFKTREEFEQMIEENKLIEWAELLRYAERICRTAVESRKRCPLRD